MHPYEFLKRYGPAALVMEVTGEPGEAFAAELAKGGFDLVLPSADPSGLEPLAARLRDHEGVEVDLHEGDIDDPHFPEALFPACEGRDIGLIVCGIEPGHPRMAGSLLSSLTRVFMPRLRARPHAGVIVVDLTGKARRLGETLAHELKPEGIDVMTVRADPGAGEPRALVKLSLEHMGHDQYVAFEAEA
jgi:SAM-dependent methyltransferase